MLIKNRYKVIRDLAKGGFGKTSLAEDLDLHNRPCVIKQLTATPDHPYFLEIQNLFKQEAKVLDNLEEAIDQIPAIRGQIPKLYAYFTEANLFYLVQQLIPGKTLLEQVKLGLFSELQVRQFLIDILPVLQVIHRCGIIHRDIKPGNLIIRESDGKPVLIDFGAVKEVAEFAANPDTYFRQTAAQETSSIIGTPYFMAPEQGFGEPVYPSTDLYGLGITVTYALSGEALGSDYTRHSLKRVLSENLSDGFRAVLEKATQIDPRNRYASAEEMLSAIQSLPPLPNPIGKTQIEGNRVRPISTRRSLLRPLAFSIAGLLAAIVGGYSYANYRIGEADRNYQTDKANLKKIEDLKKQGDYQACIAEAQQFAQSHTVSYLNSTAEAEQLGSDCASEIVKNIVSVKAKGDYTACVTKAQQLTKLQATPYPSPIAEAERLKNECAIAADLQNYLRVDIPKLLQEQNQSAVAKIVSQIQPLVQVEGSKITVIYSGSSQPEFVTNAGLQRLTAFFISALCGQSKEFPTTKYADFSSLVVYPKDKPIVATVKKAKWDSYLTEFNRASSATEEATIKQRFMEQIQISTR